MPINSKKRNTNRANYRERGREVGRQGGGHQICSQMFAQTLTKSTTAAAATVATSKCHKLTATRCFFSCQAASWCFMPHAPCLMPHATSRVEVSTLIITSRNIKPATAGQPKETHCEEGGGERGQVSRVEHRACQRVGTGGDRGQG